jgi:hypothetical protein
MVYAESIICITLHNIKGVKANFSQQTNKVSVVINVIGAGVYWEAYKLNCQKSGMLG